MFRRASALLMPSESEKIMRANEKKLAAEEAEEKKQQKLAARREQICNTAQHMAPLVHRSATPDSPDICPSPTSPINFLSTGETPFKGARRHNPLNEKRLLEKEEEKLQIAAISDHYGVNLSDAKVMLAKNPLLKRPSIKRNRTSEGELSFASYSSSSSPLTPPTPSSPLSCMPAYSSSPEGPVSDGTPCIEQSHFPFPKNETYSKHEIIGTGTYESPPRILHHSPVIRAQRPQLAHIETGMSTLSVDTTLVRPVSYLRLNSNTVPVRAPNSPGSPALTNYGSPWLGSGHTTPRGSYTTSSSPRIGSPLASPSMYSVSSYLRGEGPTTPTDDRQTFQSIPRTVSVTRPPIHSTSSTKSDDSWRSLRDERFTDEVNESMLYDMAARV